ncbi:hypothetical protein GF371_04740 [Candidatus Woesearchaeota archaeon]|nr:hypothetical protein [Candidatus Woesearchaeota archaeon]
MRIEIDTNRDSKEDIRKIIRMLTHLVGDHAVFDKAIHSFQEEQKKEQAKGPDMVNLNFLDSASNSCEKKEEKKEHKVEFY